MNRLNINMKYVCFIVGLILLALQMSDWMSPLLRQEVTLSRTAHSLSVSLQAIELSWSEQLSTARLRFLHNVMIEPEGCCHSSIYFVIIRLVSSIQTWWQKIHRAVCFVSGGVNKLSAATGPTGNWMCQLLLWVFASRFDFLIRKGKQLLVVWSIRCEKGKTDINHVNQPKMTSSNVLDRC